MGTLFNREPAMLLALVQAGLALAVGFGLTLTSEQMALLLAFTAALVGFWTRAKVSPASPSTTNAVKGAL